MPHYKNLSGRGRRATSGGHRRAGTLCPGVVAGEGVARRGVHVPFHSAARRICAVVRAGDKYSADCESW